MVDKPISWRFAFVYPNTIEIVFTCRDSTFRDLTYKYVEHYIPYIHTISLESKYRHVNIDPIAFQYTYANLHEMGLPTISLDSIVKHYYRNGTTL